MRCARRTKQSISDRFRASGHPATQRYGPQGQGRENRARTGDAVEADERSIAPRSPFAILDGASRSRSETYGTFTRKARQRQKAACYAYGNVHHAYSKPRTTPKNTETPSQRSVPKPRSSEIFGSPVASVDLARRSSFICACSVGDAEPWTDSSLGMERFVATRGGVGRRVSCFRPDLRDFRDSFITCV